jgi:hypothetical protein
MTFHHIQASEDKAIAAPSAAVGAWGTPWPLLLEEGNRHTSTGSSVFSEREMETFLTVAPSPRRQRCSGTIAGYYIIK